MVIGTQDTDAAPFGGLNPGSLYLTGEDNIRITSFGSLAGAALTIEGRLVACDGHLVPIAETHTPNSNRTANTTLITLAAGWLSNLQVRVSSGAAKRGQIFVIAELVRGRLGAVQSLGVLFSDYVAASVPIAWPGAGVASSLDGPGVVRTVLGTDPAAGAEVSDTVPTGARWRLRTVGLTLVASAAAANRNVFLSIDDGANVIWQSSANTNQTAGQTANYRAGIGVPQTTILALNFLMPLPSELVLLAGYRIRTITLSMDVGDNYGVPTYNLEEWIEP